MTSECNKALTPDKCISSKSANSFNFNNTRQALADLQKSLKCPQCSEDIVDIFQLGLCNHCFCKSCVNPKIGKICPICRMPVDASKVKVDLQLSNIASLCSQMFELINKYDEAHSNINHDDGISSTGSYSRNTENADFTNITSVVPDNDIQNASPKKSKRRSSRRNSSFPPDVGRRSQKEEKEEKMMTNTTQPQLNQENSMERNRRKLKEDTVLKQNGTKETQTKTGTEQSMNSHKDINKEEDISCVETKHKRSQKGTAYIDPYVQKKNETPKRTPRTNISKRNAKGETLLQIATIKSDLNAVKRLLQAGANPNVKDNAGWTPLHEAVNHGNVEIASLLIANGASVNAPGLENDTPLHDAVSNYQLECVLLLVSNGANISARNSHGQSPMDAAKTEEMKQLLLSSSFTSCAVETDDQAMFEEADKTICLLASVLKKEEQVVFEKFLKLFHCRKVEQFTQEVTHLVTGTVVDSVPPRTMKYLSTIISGKWIVSSKWLQACIDNGKIVSEKEFSVSGTSDYPNASRKAVENRLKQLPKLFDGCQFYLFSKIPFTSLQRDQIVELIKLGGGVMLSREPRLHNLDDYAYTRPYHAQDSKSLADCTIYKIYDDACSDPPSVQSQRMSWLPLSWLVDSVSAFTLLEKMAYIH